MCLQCWQRNTPGANLGGLLLIFCVFLNMLIVQYTFNNVGQDSHCALPLGSSFWRKWDIVVNDLILTWLTRFVLIQDDSALERQTPRLSCFRKAGFQGPDNSIVAPNVGGLCRKHSQCKLKPPVTGRIDSYHVFQKVSCRRFSVPPVDDRGMADCSIAIFCHRFHQIFGKFAQGRHSLCLQFLFHDLLDLVAHSRFLIHDVIRLIWLHCNSGQQSYQYIHLFQLVVKGLTTINRPLK